MEAFVPLFGPDDERLYFRTLGWLREDYELTETLVFHRRPRCKETKPYKTEFMGLYDEKNGNLSREEVFHAVCRFWKDWTDFGGAGLEDMDSAEVLALIDLIHYRLNEFIPPSKPVLEENEFGLETVLIRLLCLMWRVVGLRPHPKYIRNQFYIQSMNITLRVLMVRKLDHSAGRRRRDLDPIFELWARFTQVKEGQDTQEINTKLNEMERLLFWYQPDIPHEILATEEIQDLVAREYLERAGKTLRTTSREAFDPVFMTVFLLTNIHQWAFSFFVDDCNENDFDSIEALVSNPMLTIFEHVLWIGSGFHASDISIHGIFDMRDWLDICANILSNAVAEVNGREAWEVILAMQRVRLVLIFIMLAHEWEDDQGFEICKMLVNISNELAENLFHKHKKIFDELNVPEFKNEVFGIICSGMCTVFNEYCGPPGWTYVNSLCTNPNCVHPTVYRFTGEVINANRSRFEVRLALLLSADTFTHCRHLIEFQDLESHIKGFQRFRENVGYEFVGYEHPLLSYYHALFFCLIWRDDEIWKRMLVFVDDAIKLANFLLMDADVPTSRVCEAISLLDIIAACKEIRGRIDSSIIKTIARVMSKHSDSRGSSESLVIVNLAKGKLRRFPERLAEATSSNINPWISDETGELSPLCIRTLLTVINFCSNNLEAKRVWLNAGIGTEIMNVFRCLEDNHNLPPEVAEYTFWAAFNLCAGYPEGLHSFLALDSDCNTIFNVALRYGGDCRAASRAFKFLVLVVRQGTEMQKECFSGHPLLVAGGSTFPVEPRLRDAFMSAMQ